jgi:hypothetical protein
MTKPKINVKRFSRSKVDSVETEEPIIIEKKTKGRKKKVSINEEPIIEKPIIEESIIETQEEETPETFEIDDDFLSELNSSNYLKEKEEEENKENILKQQKEQEKERIKAQKEQEKYIKQLEKEQAKINRNNKAKINSDSDLYSDEGTEIKGKEKLLLLHKIKQYKQLFNENEDVKKFKIKPNANVNELKQCIDEMDVIVSTSSVDEFLTDSILQCIKLLEIPTSRTKNFNISGLSDMLKSNKQFHQLCKKLYLKYGCFEMVPPEGQLILLVATTAYVCRNKNANKDSLEAYLNESVELPK